MESHNLHISAARAACLPRWRAVPSLVGHGVKGGLGRRLVCRRGNRATGADAPPSSSGNGLDGALDSAGRALLADSRPIMGGEAMTMEDSSISPLTVALEFAQSKLREATSVREALEAEAQEVAQVGFLRHLPTQ